MSNEPVDNRGTWSMCPYYDVEAPEERRCKPDNSVCPVNGNANECDEDYIHEDLKAVSAFSVFTVFKALDKTTKVLKSIGT